MAMRWQLVRTDVGADADLPTFSSSTSSAHRHASCVRPRWKVDDGLTPRDRARNPISLRPQIIDLSLSMWWADPGGGSRLGTDTGTESPGAKGRARCLTVSSSGGAGSATIAAAARQRRPRATARPTTRWPCRTRSPAVGWSCADDAGTFSPSSPGRRRAPAPPGASGRRLGHRPGCAWRRPRQMDGGWQVRIVKPIDACQHPRLVDRGAGLDIAVVRGALTSPTPTASASSFSPRRCSVTAAATVAAHRATRRRPGGGGRLRRVVERRPTRTVSGVGNGTGGPAVDATVRSRGAEPRGHPPSAWTWTPPTRRWSSRHRWARRWPGRITHSRLRRQRSADPLLLLGR